MNDIVTVARSRRSTWKCARSTFSRHRCDCAHALAATHSHALWKLPRSSASYWGKLRYSRRRWSRLPPTGGTLQPRTV